MKHFGLATLLAFAGVVMLTGAVSSKTQQVQPGQYLWAIVPRGVLADMRVQDAFGQLVDAEAVSRAAGGSAMLKYAGGGINAPQASTSIRAVRLLLAAAGLDEPSSQLRESRTCRVWAPGADADPQQASLADALARELPEALKKIGVIIEPCRPASSLEEADAVLWPVSQQAPIPENTRGQPRPGDSFLVTRDRPSAPAPVFAPPRTGDGGLVAS